MNPEEHDTLTDALRAQAETTPPQDGFPDAVLEAWEEESAARRAAWVCLAAAAALCAGSAILWWYAERAAIEALFLTQWTPGALS